MKAVTITAVVPANAEKGTKELTGSITVQYPDTATEAIKVFGEEAVNSNAFANWRVTLQSGIRAGLKKGETSAQLQARLGSAKMGVSTGGARVDPVQAYLAQFASSTPEEQKKMLAELQERAAKK